MLRFESIVRSWSAISRSLPQFAPARRPHARRRPMLECLEKRSLLSTISLPVTSLADSGAGTLRAAITQANSSTATNKYVIPIKVDGMIDLLSPLPNLANNITIKGPGASNLTIHGLNNAIGFSIFTVNSGQTVKISGIAIQGGINDISYPTDGGGIDNTGILTISDSAIVETTAINGGGIFNSGTLTSSNNTFLGDAASNAGGAIDNVGIATVANTSFDGNSAEAGSGVVTYGGGIYNNGVLTVNESVFFENTAGFSGDGGGLYNAGTATIKHSTLVENGASYGGGSYNAGTLTIANSNFVDNIAYGNGAGIYNNGMLTIKNSVFQANNAENGGYGGGIYNVGTLINTKNHFVFNTGGDIYP